MIRLAVSPCSAPTMDLVTCLREFAGLGYRRFEAFTTWAASALDWRELSKADAYHQLAADVGMTFSSMHLPVIRAERFDATLAEAISAARFARALGAPVVLFKASDRPTYIKAARSWLDATEGLGVTPVLQNHTGAAIATLDDFRQVIDGIADPRMKTLLEVGHFHAAGVSWRQGYDLLGDSIALVHIKDMIGKQSAPFGAGEVDLPGLFSTLRQDGYHGDVVVEMEVCRDDHQRTLTLLGEALVYVRRLNGEPQTTTDGHR